MMTIEEKMYKRKAYEYWKLLMEARELILMAEQGLIKPGNIRYKKTMMKLERVKQWNR